MVDAVLLIRTRMDGGIEEGQSEFIDDKTPPKQSSSSSCASHLPPYFLALFQSKMPVLEIGSMQGQ
jgi:hypothetical protein